MSAVRKLDLSADTCVVAAIASAIMAKQAYHERESLKLHDDGECERLAFNATDERVNLHHVLESYGIKPADLRGVL